MRHKVCTSRPLALALALATLLSTTIATAQTSQAPPQNVQTAPTGTCGAFHVTAATLQDLTLPATNVREFEVGVLLGTKLCQLRLHSHEVRSPDFQLIVQDEKGSRVVATPPCVTYRGDVAGHGDSVIAASLVGGQLQAMVQLARGETFWGIQPVSEVNQTAKRQTHIVYESGKSNPPAGSCGVTNLEEVFVPTPPKTYGPNAQANKLCEIACDADYPLYVARGRSVTNTQNDVTSVVNGVAVIYKRDVAIDYQITTIIVRSVPLYTSTYLPTLLNQFASQWNRYHTNVKRDTAHLFNGGTGGGILGVASLATICNLSSAYGVSKTGFSSNMTNRVALTAHELGHNWSSPHCDGQNPCNIMCSGFGGCSRNITAFSSFAKSYITNHRNTRTCLSNAGATLTAITPNQVQVFPSSTVTLTGSGLTNVNKINVGTQAVQSGQINIVNDTKLTFVTPLPTSLLPVAVDAEVSGQRSNSLPFYWNPTSPPTLVAYTLAKAGGAMLWQYGSRPADAWFLTLSLNSSTTSLLGYEWLNSAVLIASGTLNGAGLGQIGAAVPSDVTIGVKVYSQVVTLDPIQGAFAGNTNVTLTTTSKQ